MTLPFAVPDEALFDDNVTRGWDRLALLNNPMERWHAAAAQRWGKFESRPGPLICWEPSDQTGVQSVYETFAASGSKHSDGVLIATNTDPAMFQVLANQPPHSLRWELEVTFAFRCTRRRSLWQPSTQSCHCPTPLYQVTCASQQACQRCGTLNRCGKRQQLVSAHRAT